MPIASRRASSRGRAVVRRHEDCGQRSARSDRRRTKVLDVISVPSILSAPSGKTYGMGRPAGGQRAYPRTCDRRATPVHEPRPPVDNPVDDAGDGQPPIANISILGRSDVDGRAQLRVAVVAGAPRVGEERHERLVGGAVAQDRPDVAAGHREQARVQLAVGRQAGARAVPAERPRDRRDDPELAQAVRDTASGRRPRRDSRHRPARRATPPLTVSISSAAGTTSSSRQPLECPTSMYSMKRSVTPVSRAQRAIGTIDDSFTPAPHDHVDLDRGQAGLERRVDRRRARARPGSRRRSSRRTPRRRANPG